MSDNPTLWKWEYWPDCGHQGCSDALRDTVVSQGMVPASRDDLLAALDVEPVSDGNLLDWGLDPDEVEVFWRWKAADE